MFTALNVVSNCILKVKVDQLCTKENNLMLEVFKLHVELTTLITVNKWNTNSIKQKQKLYT